TAQGVAAAAVVALPPSGPPGWLAAALADGVAAERASVALAALAALAPALLHGPAAAEETLARVALDALPDGIEVYDAPGRLALVNPRRREMFGVAPDLGAPPPAVVRRLQERVAHPERLDPAEGGDMMAAELETLEPEPHTIERIAVRVEPASGVSALVVYHDITRLRRSERLKDEFLSMASHELKTPLTTIKGYSQMLQRRLRAVLQAERSLTPQELERAIFEVEQVREEADRLNRLVDQLLDVSRIQTGRLHIARRPVDLRVALAEIIEGQRAALDGRPLRSAPARGRVPLLVEADLDRLKQVVGNLIDNAVRYSPAESPVEVRLRLAAPAGQPRRARITVSDGGMGIEPSELEQIFDRFFRSSRPRAARPAGMGLGLYISREIATQHGGRIWAESAGAGKGSSFILELPLMPTPEPQPEPRAVAPPRPLPGPPPPPL
ncbi:MAG: ATP-binding protein, partial [Chloroflexi bacterium]|nr:ATP-binding protein [Chloroflexota bacterium]